MSLFGYLISHLQGKSSLAERRYCSDHIQSLIKSAVQNIVQSLEACRNDFCIDTVCYAVNKAFKQYLRTVFTVVLNTSLFLAFFNQTVNIVYPVFYCPCKFFSVGHQAFITIFVISIRIVHTIWDISLIKTIYQGIFSLFACFVIVKRENKFLIFYSFTVV